MMPKNKKHRLKYTDTHVFSELVRKTKKWGSVVRYYKAEKSTTKKQIILIDFDRKIMHIKNFKKGHTVYSQHNRRRNGVRFPIEGLLLKVITTT